MSNIHLLTAAPSFARWPLNLHLFAKEAQTAWEKWTKSSETPVRAELNILTDFKEAANAEAAGAPEVPWGIHAMAVDYAPIKGYVEKAHNVVSFEQEGRCVHCHEELAHGQGLYPMCPSEGCVAMGHLDCWSKHALSDDDSALLPHKCVCPSCKGSIRWGDMMKELSLRVRGEKEVQKLLKKRRGA
jgi:structure-specific endonuclease subunit SLX1